MIAIGISLSSSFWKVFRLGSKDRRSPTSLFRPRAAQPQIQLAWRQGPNRTATRPMRFDKGSKPSWSASSTLGHEKNESERSRPIAALNASPKTRAERCIPRRWLVTEIIGFQFFHRFTLGERVFLPIENPTATPFPFPRVNQATMLGHPRRTPEQPGPDRPA
jgi:hypothetical protein